MNVYSPVEAPQGQAQDDPSPAPATPRWRKPALVPLPVAAAPPPPVVTVAQPLLHEVNERDDYVGRIEPSRSVEVRPRVSGADVTPVKVKVKLQDEGDYRWKGRLEFTGNGLDPKSGTIRGRAGLANPGLFLTPGLFGKMRLDSGGTTRALLVPDSAVQTDQVRKTLPTVAHEGSVAARPVQLGPVLRGLRVIRAGLSPTDRVVISGTPMTMPGMKVTVKAGRISPVSEAAPPGGGTAPIAGEVTFAR